MNDVDSLKSEIERIRRLLDLSVHNGGKLEYSTLYNAEIDMLISTYINLQKKFSLKTH